MVSSIRTVLAGVLGLALASPTSGGVQILMTVEGPRGPFATKDLGVANAIKVTNVQFDFGPSVGVALTAPRPVVVTRPIDELSWQFLEAVASNDLLRVVIVVAQTSQDAGPPQRRIVTLSNARVLAVHAVMDAAAGARKGLGLETITFTYQRIDVEDDGAKVYSSGT